MHHHKHKHYNIIDNAYAEDYATFTHGMSMRSANKGVAGLPAWAQALVIGGSDVSEPPSKPPRQPKPPSKNTPSKLPKTAIVASAGRKLRDKQIAYNKKVVYGKSKKNEAPNEKTSGKTKTTRNKYVEGEPEEFKVDGAYNYRPVKAPIFDDEEELLSMERPPQTLSEMIDEAIDSQIGNLSTIPIDDPESVDILSVYPSEPCASAAGGASGEAGLGMDSILGIAGVIGTVLWNLDELTADPTKYEEAWSQYVDSFNPYKDLNETQQADLDSMRASGSTQVELDTAAFNYSVSNYITSSGNGVVEDANVFANTAALIDGDAPAGATANITEETDTFDKANANVAQATAPLSNWVEELFGWDGSSP